MCPLLATNLRSRLAPDRCRGMDGAQPWNASPPQFPRRGGTKSSTVKPNARSPAKTNGGTGEDVFNSPESFTAYLSAEAAAIRRMLIANDESFRAEVEELDGDIDAGKLQRKDMLNRLNLDFETIRHKQRQKIVQEVEEFGQEQLLGDTTSEKMVDDMIKDLEKLRSRLCDVGYMWGRAAHDMGTLPRPMLDDTQPLRSGYAGQAAEEQVRAAAQRDAKAKEEENQAKAEAARQVEAEADAGASAEAEAQARADAEANAKAEAVRRAQTEVWARTTAEATGRESEVKQAQDQAQESLDTALQKQDVHGARTALAEAEGAGADSRLLAERAVVVSGLAQDSAHCAEAATRSQ